MDWLLYFKQHVIGWQPCSRTLNVWLDFRHSSTYTFLTSLLATPVMISIINKALKYVSEWSGHNGLNLNPNKHIQCAFSLIGNAIFDPDFNATINENALSTVDTITYLGVTFSRNVKWTNNVVGIFRICESLSFFAKKPRRLSPPAEYIRKFVEGCVIPLIHEWCWRLASRVINTKKTRKSGQRRDNRICIHKFSNR